MDHFNYRDGVLHAEDVPLPEIAAAVGTPVYVYSRATLTRHARVFREALAGVPRKHLAFAVKSNPNLAVIRLLADESYGADVVSAGEMARALAAGVPAPEIVFSGVGKTSRELAEALAKGVGQFNLESEEEGVELAAIAAARGVRAVATLRINPDVDAGSQITTVEPSRAAFEKLGALLRELRGQGCAITHMDLGGGLGVPYRRDEVLPGPGEYGAMVAEVTRGWDAEIQFEPGRVIT